MYGSPEQTSSCVVIYSHGHSTPSPRRPLLALVTRRCVARKPSGRREAENVVGAVYRGSRWHDLAHRLPPKPAAVKEAVRYIGYNNFRRCGILRRCRARPSSIANHAETDSAVVVLVLAEAGPANPQPARLISQRGKEGARPKGPPDALAVLLMNLLVSRLMVPPLPPQCTKHTKTAPPHRIPSPHHHAVLGSALSPPAARFSPT